MIKKFKLPASIKMHINKICFNAFRHATRLFAPHLTTPPLPVHHVSAPFLGEGDQGGEGHRHNTHTTPVPHTPLTPFVHFAPHIRLKSITLTVAYFKRPLRLSKRPLKTIMMAVASHSLRASSFKPLYVYCKTNGITPCLTFMDKGQNQ